MTSIHEPNYLDCNNSYLNRWQLIQKMLQQFWKRWHNEYICRLQQRPKWLLQTKNFQINYLYLTKEDNLSQLKGKWVELSKYTLEMIILSGLTVETLYGTYKRNVIKLNLLPM